MTDELQRLKERQEMLEALEVANIVITRNLRKHGAREAIVKEIPRFLVFSDVIGGGGECEDAEGGED